MNQLLIIDVQIDYIEWVLSSDLIQKIPDYAKEFDSIIYIWDSVNQSNLQDQIPDDWKDSYHLNDDQEEVEILGFDGKINFFLEKEYGFFRDFMGIEIPKNILIKLGQFLLQKKIFNFEDLIEAKEFSDEFFEKFKENKNLINIYKKNQNSLRFDFPEIMDHIRDIITNGVTLVGGGRNECLAEIALLLDILSIDYKINESLTY